MSGREIVTVSSEDDLIRAQNRLEEIWRQNGFFEFDIRKDAKQRTDQQRKAIEVYCRILAEILNDAGLDQPVVLGKMLEGVELPWDQEKVKNDIWRVIQQALLGKKSTTNLTREEVSEVYDTVNRWTSEALGVSVMFPYRG